MRLLVAALVTGVALGQPVVREVFLPDSFVGAEYPKAVCYLNWQTTSKAYVGGYGTLPSLVSFDPLTGARNSRLALADNTDLLLAQPDGPLVFAVGRHRLAIVDGARDSLVADVEYGDGPGIAALDPARQRVWLAARLYGSLARYDYSGSFRDSLSIRLTPTALCVAGPANRLYVAGRQDSVAAVDLETGTVVRHIGVGDEPSALAYEAGRNRLYVANRLGNSVSVIDCGSDSVVGSVEVGTGPVALALHAARNRLYCADRTAGRVAVVDLENLLLLALLPVSQPVALLCDSAQDRLYCGTGGSELAVIDCRADTVCARLAVGAENGALALAGASALAASYGAGIVAVVRSDRVAAVVPSATAGPRAALVCRDKLYVAEERLGAVTVFSLPGFEPRARVPVGAKPRALCRGPNSARVYVACFGDSTVYVIDAAADTVTGHIVAGNAPYHMVLDSTGEKLYCANFGSADLAVIDCRRDSLLRRVPLGRACRRLAYNRANRKVYGACHDSRYIAVLDCATDSVVAHVPTSGNPWTVVYDAADNLVYSGTSWGAPVISGAGDSAVGDIGDAFYVKGLCWDSAVHRVYMANNYSSLVLCIDAPSHTVARQLAVDALPADMVWSARSGRTFLCHNRAGRVTDQVSVIEHDSVVAELRVRPSPIEVLADPERGRVYVLNWESSCVTVVDDGTSSVEQGHKPQASGSRPGASIVRGVLRVDLGHDPKSPDGFRSCPASLLDVAGRKAMSLASGSNDISHLASGVYFVRMANGEGRVANTRVLIAK